jgi:hypothetical protein
MSTPPLQLSDDGARLTVHIPIKMQYRKGRRAIVMPHVERLAERAPKMTDRAMVKAIARAHRWRSMLEAGAFASMTDLAAAEKISPSYVCRLLRLTLLAPDIVEAILDGRQPASMELNTLHKPFPDDWEEQRRHFGIEA